MPRTRSLAWAELKIGLITIFAIVMVTVWRFAPYFMVVYLAGLQSIPTEYYDAASIDGASRGQQFRHITLPLLRPTILLVVVVSTILMSKIFTSVLIVFMLTGVSMARKISQISRFRS